MLTTLIAQTPDPKLDLLNICAAFFQRLGDGGVEVLAGGQKLVVPDGDVPAEVVLVDQPHQGLGLFPVLFAVA